MSVSAALPLDQREILDGGTAVPALVRCIEEQQPQYKHTVYICSMPFGGRTSIMISIFAGTVTNL